MFSVLTAIEKEIVESRAQGFYGALYPDIWMVFGYVDKLVKGDAAVGHEIIWGYGCIVKHSEA